MRATPLTSTGPRNLHRASPTRRPVPHTRWTKRRGPVNPIPGGSLNNYDYAGQDPINNYDLAGTSVEDDDTSGFNYFGGTQNEAETEARGNAEPKYEGVKQPKPDEIKPGDLKNVNVRELKKRGWDLHGIKREYLGEKARVSRFDLKRDSNSGFIVIVEKATGRIVDVTWYNP